MKRFVRRSAAVVLGICLGWYFAGFLPGAWAQPADQPTHATAVEGEAGNTAAPPAHHEAAEEAVERGRAAAPALRPLHESAEGEEAEHSEAGRLAAEELVPQPEGIRWYRCVLWATLGLFVAAIVLGIPALKLRGPLPPDPADSHDAHAAHDDQHRAEHAGGEGHEHSHTPAKVGPKAH